MKQKIGPIEFLGEFHCAQSLSITFRLWHAEVSQLPLLCVASFLMADDRHRHAMKVREAADHRRVVGISAIPMKFDEVFEQPLDEIQGIRPVGMPRELHPFKGSRRLLVRCSWFCSQTLPQFRLAAAAARTGEV